MRRNRTLAVKMTGLGVWRWWGHVVNVKTARRTARNAIVNAITEREQKTWETWRQARSRVSQTLGPIVYGGEWREGQHLFYEA